MKTTAGQKAKIGIFTLVGFIILVIGIFVIGSKKNMFGDTFPVYGKFKNVGGLQVGNNIRFAGINVGTVEGITIMNDTTVRVDMRLQHRVKAFLKDDAVASIGSDGLMGDKLVVIAPGVNGTGDILEKNGQIMTTNPVEYDKIIAKVTNVVDNAQIVMTSLASISNEISGGKGSLGKLIYSDSLEQGLVGTVNAAHETMKSVKAGTQGFSENMTALKHNFLLKGYFKHKKKDAAKKEKKEEKAERKEEKKQAKEDKKVSQTQSQ
jgi:phospholipid/cholesterol/gamma-HCH transport system substrate-binding protein